MQSDAIKRWLCQIEFASEDDLRGARTNWGMETHKNAVISDATDIKWFMC